MVRSCSRFRIFPIDNWRVLRWCPGALVLSFKPWLRLPSPSGMVVTLAYAIGCYAMPVIRLGWKAVISTSYKASRL